MQEAGMAAVKRLADLKHTKTAKASEAPLSQNENAKRREAANAKEALVAAPQDAVDKTDKRAQAAGKPEDERRADM